MALVEASRTSELRARFRTYKTEGVVFRLGSLTKKRTPGLSPKGALFWCILWWQMIVCAGIPKAIWDPRATITWDQGETTLCHTYICPHKSVTSQRLAHWVKDRLVEAGMDESFKAHSVRGASTSAAMARGVSLVDILSTADWSRKSTIKWFYYSEAKYTEYVSKVLQGGGNANT